SARVDWDELDSPAMRCAGSMSFRGDRVEPPDPRHALEFVFASVLELDARADQDAAHRLAHEHLTGRSQVGDPPDDADGPADAVVAADLDLGGVAPGTQLQPDGLRSGEDLGGTAQCTGRGVKGG